MTPAQWQNYLRKIGAVAGALTATEIKAIGEYIGKNGKTPWNDPSNGQFARSFCACGAARWSTLALSGIDPVWPAYCRCEGRFLNT